MKALRGEEAFLKGDSGGKEGKALQEECLSAPGK